MAGLYLLLYFTKECKCKLLSTQKKISMTCFYGFKCSTGVVTPGSGDSRLLASSCDSGVELSESHKPSDQLSVLFQRVRHKQWCRVQKC